MSEICSLSTRDFRQYFIEICNSEYNKKLLYIIFLWIQNAVQFSIIFSKTIPQNFLCHFGSWFLGRSQSMFLLC